MCSINTSQNREIILTIYDNMLINLSKHTAGFHSKLLFRYGANSACGNFTSGENPEGIKG